MKKELLINQIVLLLIEKKTGKNGAFTIEDIEAFNKENTFNALHLALLPYFLASIAKENEKDFNFKFFAPWEFTNIFNRNDGSDIVILPEGFAKSIEFYFGKNRDESKYLSITPAMIDYIESNIRKIHYDSKMFIDKQFRKLIDNIPFFFDWSDEKWLEMVESNRGFYVFKEKILSEQKLTGSYPNVQIDENKLYFLSESKHSLMNYMTKAL